MDGILAKAHVLLGVWGRPPDTAALLALVLAACALVLAVRGRGRVWLGLAGPVDVEPLRTRRFLFATGLAAALLSVAYVAVYLRGGPRIIDATTYFFQGRLLSEGHFTMPMGFPSASFRGRFLLANADGRLGGIFPPGYPLLLAAGFLVRAPMLTGPLLAAAIVVATYRLARLLAEEALPPELVEPAARLAALVSLACAALRYHTADTMSHGATALGVTLALERALAAKRSASMNAALVAGLAVGFVLATRPFSALPIAIVVAMLLGRRTPLREKLVARAALGVLPGLALLVVAQHAVTGSWLTSSQRAYYAVADGPADCFRWGFGAKVGCLYEHGAFVESRLADGYGILAALGTTLRRLHLHLADVASFEPLALLCVLPLSQRGTRDATARRAALSVVGLHVLAYAPFYFDGNYPGGGARLLADILPVEHALLATATLALVPAAHAARGAWAVLALTLAGFAVHTSYEHGKLRDRDGGAPMYEPDALAVASVSSGLVFVDTDHGFLLGHDPAARADKGLVVARLRGDERDRLLYERLGRPPTWRYDRDPSPSGKLLPTIRSFVPPASLGARLEAEAEWPPIAQRGGLAVPAWTDACASGARALALVAEGGGHAEVTIRLPVPAPGRYRITPRIVRGVVVPHVAARGDAAGPAFIAVGDVRWDVPPSLGSASASRCEDLEPKEASLSGPEADVLLGAAGGGGGGGGAPLAVDSVRVERVDGREE